MTAMENLKQHFVGVIVVAATLAVLAAGVALLLAIPFAFPLTLTALALSLAAAALWAAWRRTRQRRAGRNK